MNAEILKVFTVGSILISGMGEDQSLFFGNFINFHLIDHFQKYRNAFSGSAKSLITNQLVSESMRKTMRVHINQIFYKQIGLTFYPLHSSKGDNVLHKKIKAYEGLSCFGVHKRHMTTTNKRRVCSHPTHGGAPK